MSKKFRTIYDRTVIVSNPGTPFINDYKISNDDDGKRILVKCGKINVYQKIQAARESCDINILLDKFINTGDATVLNKAPSFYGDVTEIPTNYAEFLRLQKEAINVFNSLNLEQKAEFDNDPDVFFASFGSEKFNNIFAPKEDKSEVKNDEQKSE